MNQTVAIIILALAGFLIAFYIYTTKRHGQKLVCLIGEDCDKVVRSRWAEIFSVSNEVLGIGYYGFLVLSYSTLVFFPALRFSLVELGLAIASGLAALFSLFLTGIQVFRIKEWCEWCLASTLISVVIFLLVVI